MVKLAISLFVVVFTSSTYVCAKNESRESIPPEVLISVNAKDVQIIHRASQILGSEEKWSRKDNRKCLDKAKSFSLYCALHKASVEIIGEFDHRLAALEETRRTVEQFSKTKSYEHRLMDYNNDPSTKFKDIQKVLELTEKRLVERLAKQN